MTAACTRNLTVIARNATDGFYYTGFITRGIDGNEETHHIVFHNIKSQDVPVNHVINIGGAVPWPELKLWDYVLVRVRCKTNGIECFMPGRVKNLPIDFRYEKKFYTVELYTRGLTYKTRRCIVKIGRTKYHEIVEYIRRIRHLHPIKYKSEPNLIRLGLLIRRRPRKKVFIYKTIAAFVSHQPNRSYDCEPKVLSLSVTSLTTSSDSSRPSNQVSSGTVSSGISRGCGSSNGISLSDYQSHTVLKPGEDVLARWQDDGWYYFGKVVATEEDGFVRVLDSTGYEERIKREDILNSNENDAIQQYKKVIALHPRYVYSYAPATVLNVDKFGYRVQFYDNTERKLPGNEVYRISRRRFKKDVEYIKLQEMKLSGSQVVARDDASGIYKPCKAECPDHGTQQVFLQFSKNIYKKQSAIHIFPLDVPKLKDDRKWKYVIGPKDPACTVYLPAQIDSRRPFRLTFCDGTQSSQVQLNQCFYISEDYHKNATNYFASNCSQA